MASGSGQPRTYTISTETGSGAVRSSKLAKEIDDDATITTALDYINTDETADTLDIYFVATLSGAEITALDSVVSAHTAPSSSNRFQFWEENTADTTALQTWQTAFSRTASAVTGGIYRLTWYFELKITPSGPLNSRAAARFRIDSNIKGSAVSDVDDWVAFSGWDRYAADEGETPVLDIQFRRDNTVGGNDTIEIRKKKLGIEFMRE